MATVRILGLALLVLLAFAAEPAVALAGPRGGGHGGGGVRHGGGHGGGGVRHGGHMRSGGHGSYGHHGYRHHGHRHHGHHGVRFGVGFWPTWGYGYWPGYWPGYWGYGSVYPVRTYAYEPPVYYTVPSSVYWPPVSYSYVNPAPTTGYTEAAPPAAAPPAPAAPAEVVYPNGKYVLDGDGVSVPYRWRWVPNPAAGTTTDPLPPPR